jgi:chromosome segregation ATPase
MRSILTPLLVIASFTSALSAPEVNPAEAKLREGLKNTMLQLRAVQTEKGVLEAAKAELEQKVQTLTEQTEALTKQLADEKAASEKRITELTERVVKRGDEVMQFQGELAKSQAAHKEAAALAAKKEAERAKVNSEKIVLERKVAEQQAKNAKMFEIGNEILGRYEKFGLGTAIASREPFVGLTRIKLKNMFQELGDKLADQKIKP